MPTLPTRRQQPIPVSPQVPVPNDFPAIPQSIIDRFPEAEDWQKRLNEFWARTNQALQEAQQQTASQVNSTVVWTVDRFLIYANNGQPAPMFALDDTGIRLGNVLVVNTPARKVYIGEGVYADNGTPFYIDTAGKFSLGANLTWDPVTSTLAITGVITATSGTIGGFDIGTDYIRDTANSMGLASTVTGGDDVRFWAGDTFANRATAPFRVTESGAIVATSATIEGTVSGRDTAALAAAIDAAGNLVTDVINPRLDSSAKTILSDFDFGAVDYAGALKSGTITWDTVTGAITGGSGVAIYRGGIIGATAGVATFTIDASTGDATFAGTLSATVGSIGGWVLGATTLTGGDAVLSSTGVLTLGTADDVAVVSAADATYRLWIGNTLPAAAPFSVSKAGDLVANNASITGTISGRDTATVAAAIDSGGYLVTDLVNARLDTSAKTMLSDFSFGSTDYAGALKSGTITWNTATGAVTGGSGVLVYRGGIVGASGGVPTFTLDATTGDATFAGTITSTAGSIGGFVIGSDYIRDVANSFGLASTITGGNDIRFWAGQSFANRTIAPMRIYEDGVAVVENLTVPTNAYLAQLLVKVNQINETVTNANGSIYISYDGYNGGTTQFRDFYVYDGKHGMIASFIGATKATTLTGILSIGSIDTTPFTFLSAGTTKGVRIRHDASASYVEGVDNTGSASYYPLYLGGTVVYTHVNNVVILTVAAGGVTVNGTISASNIDSSGNVSGTASNITAYTINQNLGTADTPTFLSLDVGTGGYAVNGTKVVGAQEAAEADVTINPTITGSETLDASIVAANFDNLKTTLNNLLAKLRTHGLISP